MGISKRLLPTMLSEQIERCKYIGDLHGLQFLINSIADGVKSRASLFKLYSHNIGNAKIELEIGLLLFHELGIIDYDGSKIQFILDNKLSNSANPKITIEWFSNLLCEFLVDNGVIPTDRISYDNSLDIYYLPFNAFKRKHAVYRNLLITLSILSKRQDGSYAINSALITSIKTKNKDRKLTQKALLKILENQQRQGDAGEDFVLEFEKERLSSHPQLEKVKRISIIDVAAGFDIISFDSEDSTKLDRFIEVKTFVGKPHFHWSINEIDVAKLQGNRYFLYLVDYQKIDSPEYRPMIIQNPIEFFSGNNNWLSKAESFLIEYKGDYN